MNRIWFLLVLLPCLVLGQAFSTFQGTVSGFIVDQKGAIVKDTIEFWDKQFKHDEESAEDYHVQTRIDTIYDGLFSVHYDSVFDLCWGVGGPRVVDTGGCFPTRSMDTTGYVIQVRTIRFPEMQNTKGSVADMKLVYSYSDTNYAYLKDYGKKGIGFVRNNGALPEKDRYGSILHITAETYLAPKTPDGNPQNLKDDLALYPSPSKPCLYYPLPPDTVEDIHGIDEAPHYKDPGWVDTLMLFDDNGEPAVNFFYVYFKWSRRYAKAHITKLPEVDPENLSATLTMDILVNKPIDDRRLATYER